MEDPVTLKEHFNERLRLHEIAHDSLKEMIKSLYTYVDLKSTNIEKSTTLARESMEKRLESMNEFRASLKDQRNEMVTRAEYTAKVRMLDEDIRTLREAKANLEGKASMSSVYIAYIISAISIGLSLIKLFQ